MPEIFYKFKSDIFLASFIITYLLSTFSAVFSYLFFVICEEMKFLNAQKINHKVLFDPMYHVLNSEDSLFVSQGLNSID